MAITQYIIRIKNKTGDDSYIWNWSFENGISRTSKVVEGRLYDKDAAEHIVHTEQKYDLSLVEVTIHLNE